MTSGVIAVCSLSGLTAIGVALAAQAESLEPIEKYGILGLLYIVLVGVGVFIAWVGRDMNKSIKDNTKAVTELVTEMKLDRQKNEEERRSLSVEMVNHTDRVVAVFRDGLQNLRDEVRGSGR